MNNLFTLAANETTTGAVFFLNSIFGTVGDVLGGTGPQLLGDLFKVFNTTVLALGSLIVTYTTVVSILLTAHEGEALGKKFHSLWLPIRTVMGIAALVPTTSGYSYLQIGLMWFIIQGIGAADTLWTETVNYVASGSSTAPNPSSTPSTALQMQFSQLFQGLVCQAAAKANYASGYFCADNASNSFCTASDTLSVTAGSSQVVNGVYQMGPSGICGSLTLGDSSTVGQAKNQAFSQIIPTLGSLASQLVGLDYGYNTFINSVSTTTPSPPSWITAYCSDHNLSGAQCNPSAFSAFPAPTPSNSNQSKSTVQDLYWTYGLLPIAGGNFLSFAASLYTGIVGASQTQNGSSNALANVQTTAINNGWIFAGGYFYYIAQANNKISTNVGTITVTGPEVSTLPLPTEQALTSASMTLTQYISSTLPTTSGNNMGLSSSCGSSSYAGGGNALCESIINSWINKLSSSSGGNLSENPVLAAQSEGHEIINAIEIVIPILIAINVALGFASGVFLGTGFPAVATVITQSIVPVAMFVILVFLGIGLTLAVYTPMIPYMLFTFGAINWLIATIETMIAAPLVAIGLLHPEGHELWGQAEKALMLLLNIFLRPSLMIFGLIAGMLMTYTVVMMINYAFLNVVAMVSGGGANAVEMIFFMVLYTSLFTTAMNKCFELIHVVPDRVLRWIGGGQEQFGEGGAEKISQTFEAGGQKAAEAAGAGRTGFKSAHGSGKSYGKAKGLQGQGRGNQANNPNNPQNNNQP